MVNILTNRYMIDSDWCFESFQKHIQKDHKIVVIPFSFRETQISSNESWQSFYSEENGIYYSGIVDSFNRYGICKSNIKWINYFRTSNDEAKRLVQDADVIYLTGGLPDKMMARLNEFELIETIEQHKGIILGFSAGAVVQFKQYHLSPDYDYEAFRYYEGMNMIDDFSIEVHFCNSDMQLNSIKQVTTETKKPVYAMEDEGAVIVTANGIEVVGKVHVFTSGNF